MTSPHPSFRDAFRLARHSLAAASASSHNLPLTTAHTGISQALHSVRNAARGPSSGARSMSAHRLGKPPHVPADLLILDGPAD